MGKLVNRAKMTVSGTPGSGAITLGSAVSGFQTFAAAGVSNGDVVSYVIEDGTGWEYGQGTYTASGTLLTRTTVQGSSNSGSAISATSGAVVYITALASDVGASALTLLAVLTPSGVATVDDTTHITSTYDDYMIVLENVVPVTSGANLWLRFSTNGGSSYATSGYDQGGAIAALQLSGTCASTASGGVSGEICLFNLNSTTAQRLAIWQTAYSDSGGGGMLTNSSGGAFTTTGAAINAIRLMFSTGNIASGKIKIYGVQKS